MAFSFLSFLQRRLVWLGGLKSVTQRGRGGGGGWLCKDDSTSLRVRIIPPSRKKLIKNKLTNWIAFTSCVWLRAKEQCVLHIIFFLPFSHVSVLIVCVQYTCVSYISIYVQVDLFITFMYKAFLVPFLLIFDFQFILVESSSLCFNFLVMNTWAFFNVCCCGATLNYYLFFGWCKKFE